METDSITLMNINSNVGDMVVVTDGKLIVMPWLTGGDYPLSSAQPSALVADGNYMIRDVKAESIEPGCAKLYSIKRVGNEVIVARDHNGQRFYDHKLAAD